MSVPAPPHPGLTMTVNTSPGKEIEAHESPRHRYGVPIILHTYIPRLPEPGDIGYFLNGHVQIIDGLRFVPAAPQYTGLTTGTVLDMFCFVDEWHRSAQARSPAVCEFSLTSKEMIFVSWYDSWTQARAHSVQEGLIRYYKIRRRWFPPSPGKCGNVTCEPVFPTRVFRYGGSDSAKDPEYVKQPFDPVDEPLTYLLSTPIVDCDGAMTFPANKAVASVDDLFALFGSAENIPRVSEIHDALRESRPRSRFIKWTDVAAFERTCEEFELGAAEDILLSARDMSRHGSMPLPQLLLPPLASSQGIVRTQSSVEEVQRRPHPTATVQAHGPNDFDVRAQGRARYRQNANDERPED
ncbi:hypothetical protein L226DRAFT_617226 [Lentinus tigrinus ALCF2SS1-7]|uniref:uncharacterized protein n=1 Tax=Lentinus tigrinus ALCF2SS1-7 TaxID=1328758 RepID=UPI0011662CE8|nr:hypothetical protein L226DRAFT_617226 [Lentinus tigrinus ALCF2SS1-7]